MADYDFSNLTERQKELLTFQAWTAESATRLGIVSPSPRAVKKLIDRGLVIQHERRFGYLTIIEYEIPLSVHIAWCEYCARSGNHG